MIKQRILYVGIGGSGIDLGIELDSALKREICGLDGNALAQRGMPYKTNELPPFVQQVYIDFAAAALKSVANRLEGSNARTITNIIPPYSNYAAVAASLRMKNLVEIAPWLPSAANEPNVNPLSAGAGQYPTVGRAAMFQSIQGQGLDQAVLGSIRDAIADLSGSMGDLMTYAGGTASTNVAVYVGFSASGGTGAGLFYDLLLMLIDELRQHMVGSNVTVIPAVLLPSTFDGVLPPIQWNRGQLNASTALVDLANMIEQMTSNSPSSDEFDVVYPTPGSKTYKLQSSSSTVQMPVAAVISNTPGMTRDDIVRMLASAIVTQVSITGSTGGDGQVQNTMTFGENVVNWQGIITMNPSSVMHKPLMPMVSASLTVPSRKIADIVAKSLLLEAFTPGAPDPKEAEKVKELGNRILKACNLTALIDGETFKGSYNVSFSAPTGIKSEDQLRSKITKLQTQIDSQAIPVVQTQIVETLRTMTTFDILDGMEQIFTADPLVPLPTLAAAAQNALSRLNLPESSDTAPNTPAVSGRRRQQKKTFLSVFIPNKKLKQQDVKQEFELQENEFNKRVQEMWWKEWANHKHQWKNSVTTGQNRVADLSSWWSNLLSYADDSARQGSAAVKTPRLGVRDFVPTRGVSVDQALKNIYEDTKTSMLGMRSLTPPTTHNLVQAVLGEGTSGGRSALRDAINIFRRNSSQHDFNERILERLRREVHSVFSRSVDGQQPAFNSLGSLLEEMIHSSPGSDAIALKTELGNLVPGVLVPRGGFQQASVNITYPGNTNVDIENQIAELVFSSGALKDLISAGPADGGRELLKKSGVSVAAVGDSDSLTVNINLIGQTLFDNEEICTILQSWQNEISDPDTQKLRWRQRLGYENMDRILVGSSRTRTLHKLLLGLWGGQIEVTQGTNENPERLVIFDTNRQQPTSALPVMTLNSGWSDLLKSFERLQINLRAQGTFSADVIEQLLLFVPSSLKSSMDVEVPPVISALLAYRKTTLEEAESALKRPREFGNQAINNYQRVITFWDKEFRAAWNLENTGLHAASLSVLFPLDA